MRNKKLAKIPEILEIPRIKLLKFSPKLAKLY